MVSPHMLSKVTSAHDHRQALGGYVHLPFTFIFPHPEGITESQSKVLWGAAEISRSQQHGSNTK